MTLLNRNQLSLGLIIVLCTVIASLFLDRSSIQQNGIDWPPPRLNISNCMDRYQSEIAEIKKTKTVSNLTKIVFLCNKLLHNQGLLDDFQIRRSKFYQQNYSDTVILWMVVIITVSGVALAALQLIISYRIAAGNSDVSFSGGESEFELAKGNVSFRSSVVGIMILFVSLGFFWLYVLHVYKINEIDPDNSGGNNHKYENVTVREQKRILHGSYDKKDFFSDNDVSKVEVPKKKRNKGLRPKMVK